MINDPDRSFTVVHGRSNTSIVMAELLFCSVLVFDLDMVSVSGGDLALSINVAPNLTSFNLT